MSGIPGYTLVETLQDSAALMLRRGHRDNDLAPVLVLSPAKEPAQVEILARLEHEYALRAELDPAWSAQPLDMHAFLPLAIALADAVGRMHAQGLLHKDIKPANMLVEHAGGCGKRVGLLYLENKFTPCVFTPSRIALLELLASQAAISLENATLHHELQREESAIRELNETLESRVKQRSAELEQANTNLSNALESLKHAQSDLIAAEKMASLGALVAGIAHELNTPIGNSLLVASTLKDRMTDMERAIGDGSVKRSKLLEDLSNTRLACTMMEGSLDKVANLISSFKQVAVDQTSDQRRVFDLRDILQNTLTTFAPRLKRDSCEASLDVPAGLNLDSFPGSIGQIMNNLINNALMHAFDGRPSGSIHISAHETDGDWVRILFKDDGCGMPPEVLHHVFDPLFTTKMGQGGTGLGMNIVYNIVTGVLGGRITIESEVGAGTTVAIAVPKNAPVRERGERLIV